MSKGEQPMAVVAGNKISEMPSSLYIPPAALRVALENFEGPLDFLHYLIRRDDMDIRDIPMAELTRQYLLYVDEVVDQQLELAADYLLMSATLIEIKSRILIPKPEVLEQEAEDPRAELVQRLIAYARIRAAAIYLQKCPIMGRDLFCVSLAQSKLVAVKPKIDSKMFQVAMLGVRDRQAGEEPITYSGELITVRGAMANIFIQLKTAGSWLFSQLLGKKQATPLRAATFFLAVLQMSLEQIIRTKQRSEDDFQVVARNLNERNN